jgi:hypothetical protein
MEQWRKTEENPDPVPLRSILTAYSKLELKSENSENVLMIKFEGTVPQSPFTGLVVS